MKLAFIGFLLLLAYFIITGPARKKREEAYLENLSKQLLTLFVENERLTASQVSGRLQERTGGRKTVSDFSVIKCLERLVEAEKLKKERTPTTFVGEAEVTVYTTEYFLPS